MARKKQVKKKEKKNVKDNANKNKNTANGSVIVNVNSNNKKKVTRTTKASENNSAQRYPPSHFGAAPPVNVVIHHANNIPELKPLNVASAPQPLPPITSGIGITEHNAAWENPHHPTRATLLMHHAGRQQSELVLPRSASPTHSDVFYGAQGHAEEFGTRPTFPAFHDDTSRDERRFSDVHLKSPPKSHANPLFEDVTPIKEEKGIEQIGNFRDERPHTLLSGMRKSRSDNDLEKIGTPDDKEKDPDYMPSAKKDLTKYFKKELGPEYVKEMNKNKFTIDDMKLVYNRQNPTHMKTMFGIIVRRKERLNEEAKLAKKAV